MCETATSAAVELYGAEALAEVIGYIKKIKVRCRDPIITSDEVCRMIQTHFGLNHVSGRLLKNYVIRTLRERGILRLWDTRELAEKTVIEYRVNLAPTSALCA